MPQEYWANFVFSLVPTVVIGLIFWYILRGIIRSDRREREVAARIDAEERAKAGLPPRA